MNGGASKWVGVSALRGGAEVRQALGLQVVVVGALVRTEVRGHAATAMTFATAVSPVSSQ